MRYGRVPGGFEMFATAINDGAGCQFRPASTRFSGFSTACP